MAKRSWWYRFRSAISGQTITAEEAAAHPESSVRERVDESIVDVRDLGSLRIRMPNGVVTKVSSVTAESDWILLNVEEPQSQR